MTLAQLLLVLNWLVNIGIPVLVAFVTKREASSTAKALTNLVASLVAAALLTLILDLSSHAAIDWFAIIFAILSGFVVSGASYTHLWKPTGVIAATAPLGRHSTGVNA